MKCISKNDISEYLLHVTVTSVCENNLFIARSESFPNGPGGKDIHSLYFQYQQRPFLKVSKKNYKFKIPVVKTT